jgi:putative acetyltransferase
MRLRRATREDADAIAELFRASYGSIGFLPTLHTPEEDRGYFRGVVADEEVWVAERDGDLVGFAALTPAELDHLYVRPGEQGRGVGTALLDLAKLRRPDGFTFWVFQRNERARHFYERHGCHVVRLGDGSENEEREPDALYAWRP